MVTDTREHVQELHGAFGADRFGQRAEAFARWFGTPAFLVAQSVIVAAWIAANMLMVRLRWDPYPFILLNLAFSLQAAYAAPLILLAQTRQADRDKAASRLDSERHEHQQARLLAQQRLIEELAERMTEQLGDIQRRLDALPHDRGGRP